MDWTKRIRCRMSDKRTSVKACPGTLLLSEKHSGSGSKWLLTVLEALSAQIAVMHRYLVEEKRWISESRFLHALNYCMLLPGPEAQQLAIYIGWLLHRIPGGIVAGTLFVIPGFHFNVDLEHPVCRLSEPERCAVALFRLETGGSGSRHRGCPAHRKKSAEKQTHGNAGRIVLRRNLLF